MNYTEIEAKLINLALNHAAHEGEFQNAATMLFKQLRKRGVTAQQFNGHSHSSGANYEPLYLAERQTSELLRRRIAAMLSTENSQQAEINRLKEQLIAAQAGTSARTYVPKAKGRYFGGILLTDIEREMLIRIATYYAAEGSDTSVMGVCKNNREQGSIQGLIKKGLVEKRYSSGSRKRLGLTEAGLAHFRQYHRS